MSSPQMMTMLGLCCCCATTGAVVMAATDMAVSKNRALVIFMMEASLLQRHWSRRIIKFGPFERAQAFRLRACRRFIRERYSASAVVGLKLQKCVAKPLEANAPGDDGQTAGSGTRGNREGLAQPL